MIHLARLKPLIGWLLLLAIVSAVLPIPDQIMDFSLIAALVLFVVATPARRQTLFLIPFLAVTALAFIFPLPLPDAWAGLIRLGAVLTFWILVAVAAAAATLALLGIYRPQDRKREQTDHHQAS